MWYNEFMVKKSSKEIVSWEAVEYLHRDKNAGWYIGFILVVAILAVLSVLLQWWTFTALIALSAIALILYSVRPPRTLQYSLTEKGLIEGNNFYSYDSFKSFGIMKDDDNYAIVLMPRKRFSPRIMVFFPEKSGEQIVDAFGARLPMEEVKLDYLDRIVKLLRI